LEVICARFFFFFGGVPFPLSYFPQIFQKKRIFGGGGGGKVLNTKFVFWFYLQISSATFHIMRRTEQDIITNVYRSSCKVPVILVRFEWNLNFLNRFSRNSQISNFMKTCPVGAELLHADGRTDYVRTYVRTDRQTGRHDEVNSRF